MLDKRSSTAHAALRAGAGTATKAVTAVAAAEGTLPAARRRDEADASANEADNGALRASKGAVATRRRRAEEAEMSMDDLPEIDLRNQTLHSSGFNHSTGRTAVGPARSGAHVNSTKTGRT
jgi:hypothetical protein